ncbi:MULTISPECIES: hypothetical protein [unclassified Sulfitobacter]|uniref:hypothetical protein n=1 Tax=unclassified Sulfitobacter TaxID=196795 RepID=UPI0007C32844|nr:MULTISPECIES: hypothetical protein [unclassified Sulfitobacter]KZX91686.1 hypothetical protein A3720_22925 [Sulfitobacter sp. HI0021]KZX99897.1 hypothetical protein A3722_21950 [Sulfitobacter sp. HI0027]KZY99268.1 hypothetical protein A3747_22550 [Sulfitobacter sp. HI0076]
MADADRVLDARTGELETVDQAMMGEVVGVAQAVGDLRKALDELDGQLDARRFEKAAALGYQDGSISIKVPKVPQEFFH